MTSLTGTGLVTPTFDASGNMNKDEKGHTLIYDAWNRLAQVQAANGTVLATYGYDALNRRITEVAGGITKDLYYSEQWQVLEERYNGASTDKVSNVWGAEYVNALVCRDFDANANGAFESTERLWSLYDANYNVTALVTPAGAVQQRFVYDPYGVVTVLDASWAKIGDGSASNAVQNATTFFQGGRYDTTSGLYSFQNRDYTPTLQRWTERDPAGYKDGMDLYAAFGGAPVGRVDPEGLEGETISDLAYKLNKASGMSILAVTYGSWNAPGVRIRPQMGFEMSVPVISSSSLLYGLTSERYSAKLAGYRYPVEVLSPDWITPDGKIDWDRIRMDESMGFFLLPLRERFNEFRVNQPYRYDSFVASVNGAARAAEGMLSAMAAYAMWAPSFGTSTPMLLQGVDNTVTGLAQLASGQDIPSAHQLAFRGAFGENGDRYLGYYSLGNAALPTGTMGARSLAALGRSSYAFGEAQIVVNKGAGTAREVLVGQELRLQYPEAAIQRETYLRLAEGDKALDPLTQTGRRIDWVVLQDGAVLDSVETTSMTANKAAQIAKEMRIRQAGGVFVRDRATGQLIDISQVPTRILRKP